MATCAQNVDWSFEADGDLRDVLVDAGQIERLVLNLVRNACQAMPGGGRLLVTAVNHEVTGTGQGLRPGPHVAISVRDWGPGIPQDYLPHLFNSRFTTKEDGNGCGLAICHQIARDHGGEIFVQSRPQVGTVFHVVLPALETAALAGDAEGMEGKGGMEALGRGLAVAMGSGGRAMPSLLVVDDEEGIRFSLGAIAARLGCPVEVVSSGDEAIQRYRERHRSGRAHDMVILDINLKGMGGEEVFRELRRLDRGATVLATSGQYSDAELSRYEAMGFAGFLPKPFSVDEFREMLERFAAAV
jgi:CheY-like chemotaxis protein